MKQGKMIVDGNVENVLFKGNQIVVVIDESVQGGQREIKTTDVKSVKKVRHVFGRVVNTGKKKRKRMSKVEMLCSSSPVITVDNTVI